MGNRYPFCISIPHGGTKVPIEVEDRVALAERDLRYYSDPDTRILYDLKDRVNAWIDTPITRLVVDLNRPPTSLPPRHRDGVVKVCTIDGKDVYHYKQIPAITLIHQLMMQYYFPYHATLDQLLQEQDVQIAFDCHSMLPNAPPLEKDAGKRRPLICLGNHGDSEGREKVGTLSTCPGEWIQGLADAFREVFSLRTEVAINDPFSGGFIANAHYWRKGVPWIQIEVNRALYEPGTEAPYSISSLRDQIWSALQIFWETRS